MNFDEFWKGFTKEPMTSLAKAMKFKSSVPANHTTEDQIEWLFEVITMHDQEDNHPDERDPVIDCCVEELKMYYSLCVNSHEQRCMEWEEEQNEINNVFENAWNDPRWVGSDVSFDECYYVFDKKHNLLWFQRRFGHPNDQLWDRWDVNQHLVTELEEIVSVSELVSFCNDYEEYDVLGKLTTILSYDCDPYGAYEGLIDTKTFKANHYKERLMFIRDTSDPNQVVIIVESHHRRLESQMGRYDRWHALIHDSQYVVVISWTTSLPYVGVEVFDLESSSPDDMVDEMFHQENGVYESLIEWDSLCRESDEKIGNTVWEEYQKVYDSLKSLRV